MAITLEVWEDAGAKTGAVGTIRQQVNNIGWKDSILDETYPSVDYPVRRQTSGSYTSFTKYNYFKMSGTYPVATRFRVQLVGDVNGAAHDGLVSTDDLRIYYKWTDTYETPTNTLMTGGAFFTDQSPVWYPDLSTTGPELATSRPNTCAANTTYWSAYLVTQLYVSAGAITKFGNIGALSVVFNIDEYENTDY